MLQLKDVRKAFGEITAVDGLSMELRPGQVLGLLGPNGAGKTTTISMSVGLLRPDSGTVRLIDAAGNTHDPSHGAARALIGLAPQSIALYDELTAAENLAFFGRLYGLGGVALRQRIQGVLALTGLADRAGSRAKTFSGGMKRRLNLAAAVLHEPRLVFMDEPTAGVDPQSRNAIFEIVRELRDRGCTVVYSTHYMEEAQKLCDAVAIMDRGRLLAMDAVPALIARHGGQSTVTVRRGEAVKRLPTDDPIAVLSAELASARVDAATIDSPDLETVFLRLTGRTLRD
jgi:ABC-2 type transport system ATP-binding protein